MLIKEQKQNKNRKTTMFTGEKMAVSKIDEFSKERERLNDIVMKGANPITKRFYSLDNQTYRDGALPARTKELLGLVASFVLRCDDCIKYHLILCHELGYSGKEIREALNVGMVIGGTITIPHLRHAMETWSELEKKENDDDKEDNEQGRG